jgi:hypothetical protein
VATAHTVLSPAPAAAAAENSSTSKRVEHFCRCTACEGSFSRLVLLLLLLLLVVVYLLQGSSAGHDQQQHNLPLAGILVVHSCRSKRDQAISRQKQQQYSKPQQTRKQLGNALQHNHIPK